MAGPDLVSRRSGRVLPVDPGGRVLLLRGHGPADPGHPFWFTIGGGTSVSWFPQPRAGCGVKAELGHT